MGGGGPPPAPLEIHKKGLPYPMSTKIVIRGRTKAPEAKKEGEPEVKPDVAVGLAQSMLEILDYLQSTPVGDSTVELVDSVKPRLEAIIRSA